MATTTDLATEDYQFLKEYIHRESGILLDNDKHYLLAARLAPVAEQIHLDSLSALANTLRNSRDSTLRDRVVQAMTTHETLFFRDSSPFDALRTTVLPQLAKLRENTKTLRIWSAASSSGQEAYSIAMTLAEAGLERWNIQILATDLSKPILDRAKEGRYSQLEMNRGLPAAMLVKYFEREGLEWRVKDSLRRMMRFETFDLRRSMLGKGPFDIIFCRNVLIYFDIPTKKQILAGLRNTLVPGGYLLLGGSESTLNLDETFLRIPVGRAMFYQAPE
jgi:chemotaxis protein methyltransferase CheR